MWNRSRVLALTGTRKATRFSSDGYKPVIHSQMRTSTCDQHAPYDSRSTSY